MLVSTKTVGGHVDTDMVAPFKSGIPYFAFGAGWLKVMRHESLLRRWIRLISAGWLPPCMDPSWRLPRFYHRGMARRASVGSVSEGSSHRGPYRITLSYRRCCAVVTLPG
jgi:hypothetical protein